MEAVAPRVSSPVFVGRVHEIARLRGALEQARSGSSAVVVVAGEAGVGKTRLVAELRREARDLDVLTLTGGCLDVGDGVVPFAPLVAALRPLTTRLEPADAPHAVVLTNSCCMASRIRATCSTLRGDRCSSTSGRCPRTRRARRRPCARRHQRALPGGR